MGNAFLHGQGGNSGKFAYGTSTSKTINPGHVKSIGYSSAVATGYVDTFMAIEILNLGWVPKYIFAISISANLPVAGASTSLSYDVAFHIDEGIKVGTDGVLFQQFFTADSGNYGEIPLFSSVGNSYVSRTNAYQTSQYAVSGYPGIPFTSDVAYLVVGGSEHSSKEFMWVAVG